MSGGVPIVPTSVCGSHALPGWMYRVSEARDGERPTDVQERYGPAVRTAIRDQVEAGIDVISNLRSTVAAARLVRRELSGRT